MKVHLSIEIKQNQSNLHLRLISLTLELPLFQILRKPLISFILQIQSQYVEKTLLNRLLLEVILVIVDKDLDHFPDDHKGFYCDFRAFELIFIDSLT